MKKKIVVLLTVAMTVACLTACGNKENETTTVSGNEAVTEDGAGEGEGIEESNDSTGATQAAELELLDSKSPAEYNLDELVEIGDYKNFTVSVAPASVSEEQIDSYVTMALAGATSPEAGITDRPVADGDTVNIDYEGKLDGVAFDGGTAQGASLIIGSGRFIDGFESGLVEKNAKPGDTVDLELTFPEDYPKEELKGKDVVFTVTVNFIVATNENFTDAMAHALDESCATVEEYRLKAKDSLMADAEEARQKEIGTEAMKAFTASCTFKVDEMPEEIANIWYNQTYQALSMYASMYGVDIDTFVKYMGGYDSFDAMKEDVMVEAKDMAKQFVAVQAVANAEGIEVTDEEILTTVSQYGYSSLEDLKAAGADIEIERFLMVYEKVQNLLTENATVEDK